jgi:hypothetical protein
MDPSGSFWAVDQRSRSEIFVLGKDFFDLTKFIRSMQRAEGGPDCFGRAQGHCERLDCVWRRYCLNNPQGEATSRTHESIQIDSHQPDAERAPTAYEVECHEKNGDPKR